MSYAAFEACKAKVMGSNNYVSNDTSKKDAQSEGFTSISSYNDLRFNVPPKTVSLGRSKRELDSFSCWNMARTISKGFVNFACNFASLCYLKFIASMQDDTQTDSITLFRGANAKIDRGVNPVNGPLPQKNNNFLPLPQKNNNSLKGRKKNYTISESDKSWREKNIEKPKKSI